MAKNFLQCSPCVAAAHNVQLHNGIARAVIIDANTYVQSLHHLRHSTSLQFEPSTQLVLRTTSSTPSNPAVEIQRCLDNHIRPTAQQELVLLDAAGNPVAIYNETPPTSNH